MSVRIIVIIALLGIAWGQAPQHCCAPSKFTAERISLTATLTSGSTNPDINDVVVHELYDYDGQRTKLTGGNLLDPVTGGRSNYTIYRDYKHSREYKVVNGVCTQTTLDSPLLSPCIPSNFTMTGTYRIGSSGSNQRVQVWTGVLYGTLRFNYHVTEDDCTPVAYNFFGNLADGSAIVLDTIRFLDVRRDVTLQDSDFALPDECKHGAQAVGK
ncbi:uncharacterized protein LOC128217345 [Mya arenaria]|uniref:uncharacterized protein LOC128217345 n=1 Tax=Mya arenaria TaxID=6604 RepID=UPI0022E14D57|nr:uncharacterized protein LOC128217345 [Mya arenaria]